MDPDSGSDNALWQELGIANKGCVAIFVTRGYLTTDQPRFRSRRKTDPPESHHFDTAHMPKIIRSDWFKPHRNYVRSRVMITEFRNIDDTDDGTIPVSASRYFMWMLLTLYR